MSTKLTIKEILNTYLATKGDFSDYKRVFYGEYKSDIKVMTKREIGFDLNDSVNKIQIMNNELSKNKLKMIGLKFIIQHLEYEKIAAKKKLKFMKYKIIDYVRIEEEIKKFNEFILIDSGMGINERVDKICEKYEELNEKLIDICTTDIQRNCEDASIKWELNNCDFDTGFMMLLFQIHSHILKKLILFPRNIYDNEKINDSIYEIYEGINNPKTNTTCTLFRKTVFEQTGDRNFRPGEYTSDFPEKINKMYNLDIAIFMILSSKHTITGTHPWGIIENIYQRTTLQLLEYLRYVNTGLKKYNIFKKLFMKLNNGYLMLKVTYIDITKTKFIDHYEIPESIATYINNDENMIFELQGIQLTLPIGGIGGRHAIAYIKCNSEWYDYDGRRFSTQMKWKKIGDIANLNDQFKRISGEIKGFKDQPDIYLFFSRKQRVSNLQKSGLKEYLLSL